MPTDKSYLSAAQVDLLMRELHASRVLNLDGNDYLAQWDVRAMLTRVFGFGRWSQTLVEPTTMLYEQETVLKNGSPGYKIAYKASVALTVMAPDGTVLAVYEASGVGEHTMPDRKRGDGHDNAIKTAESAALKRCAINLGTQFGLGLYNNGFRGEVIRVIAMDPRQDAPAQGEAMANASVEVQGDDDLAQPEGDA